MAIPGSPRNACCEHPEHGRALIVLSPELPVGFIEIKTDKGRIRPEQQDFAAMCDALHIHHAITRGRDEPIRILEAWGVTKPERRAA